LPSTKAIVCAIGLFLAFGATQASAAQADPTRALVQTVSNSTQPTRDLGDLPPPGDPDNPTPASTSTVSSAEPVPELPTWAMILLCFAGLGLAGFKRGRKDRLSPGLE
jgi:hypothetical protein